MSLGLAARLVHDVPGRLDPSVPVVGDHGCGATRIPALFWPTVVLPGILFTLAGALSVHRSEDDQGHAPSTTCCSGRATCRCAPRSARWRSTFYLVLFLSGGNDLIAKAFDISLNAMTWGGRIALLVAAADRLPAHLPDLPGPAAPRPRGARARRRDRHHQACCRPVSSSRCTSRSARWTSTATAQLEYAGAPVPKRMNRITNPGRKAMGFLWKVQEAQDEAGPHRDRARRSRPSRTEPAGRATQGPRALDAPLSRGPDGSTPAGPTRRAALAPPAPSRRAPPRLPAGGSGGVAGLARGSGSAGRVQVRCEGAAGVGRPSGRPSASRRRLAHPGASGPNGVIAITRPAAGRSAGSRCRRSGRRPAAPARSSHWSRDTAALSTRSRQQPVELPQRPDHVRVEAGQQPDHPARLGRRHRGGAGRRDPPPRCALGVKLDQLVAERRDRGPQHRPVQRGPPGQLVQPERAVPVEDPPGPGRRPPRRVDRRPVPHPGPRRHERDVAPVRRPERAAARAAAIGLSTAPQPDAQPLRSSCGRSVPQPRPRSPARPGSSAAPVSTCGTVASSRAPCPPAVTPW